MLDDGVRIELATRLQTMNRILGRFQKPLQEASQMKDSPRRSTESQASTIKYCDRCARRSLALFSDDLTLQELCQECCDRLKRKRTMAPRPAERKM